MKKAIMKGMLCIMVLCMSGCQESVYQKSGNYQLTKDSKEKTLPIYEEDDEEISRGESALQTLRDEYKSGYACEEWVNADVESPGGILWQEQEIIISDRKNDCIIKADDKGNTIKKVGRTGNGDGEFLSPGAVGAYGDEIYVIDEGNQRV